MSSSCEMSLQEGLNRCAFGIKSMVDRVEVYDKSAARHMIKAVSIMKRCLGADIKAVDSYEEIITKRYKISAENSETHMSHEESVTLVTKKGCRNIDMYKTWLELGDIRSELMDITNEVDLYMQSSVFDVCDFLHIVRSRIIDLWY